MESFSEKKDQAETDCVYTRTGFCDDCRKPPEEKCPYEEDEEESKEFPGKAITLFSSGGSDFFFAS